MAVNLSIACETDRLSLSLQTPKKCFFAKKHILLVNHFSVTLWTVFETSSFLMCALWLVKVGLCILWIYCLSDLEHCTCVVEKFSRFDYHVWLSQFSSIMSLHTIGHPCSLQQKRLRFNLYKTKTKKLWRLSI